jgi:hypothetical protein
VTVATRVYRDYLQRGRLDELLGLILRALQLGYEPRTLSTFAAAPEAGDRILLLRHDIDSDVPRARRMWAIERQAGVVGSWFFRRSTWDVPLMRELAAHGCDVGYHYEELSTLVKQRGAATPGQARTLIGPARDRLRAALDELRADSGLPLDVLASHGDFANRAVDVSNVELLEDGGFRARVGVRLEAYDVEGHVDARSTDSSGGRRLWWPSDPLEALERGARVVEVLVHPRAWGAAPLVNARLDLERLVEGGRYALRRRRG